MVSELLIPSLNYRVHTQSEYLSFAARKSLPVR